MLTGFQLETVAYEDDDGDLFCYGCFDKGDRYCVPVVRYSLDERESSRADVFEGDDEGHHPDCECTMGMYCDGCGEELSEPYEDPRCDDLDPRAEGEDE